MSQALVSPLCCPTECTDPVVENIPGPQGIPGAAGTNGTDGINAFTDLAAAFTVPDAAVPASATVDNSDWAVVGQIIFLEGAGYFAVTSVPDSTHVVLDNTDYPGNAADGTIIAIGSHLGPGGLIGATGAAGGGGDMLYADNLNNMASNDASLGNLGGTAAGLGFFKIVSPSAVTFPRINADNTVTARTAANLRTDLGLVIGTDVQAYDADLTTWAGVTPSANAQTFVAAADYSAMRTALGVIADNYALFEHQQANGVDGGTFTSGAWRTVPLTTEVSDPNTIGSLAANEVTVAAGTYRFRAWTTAFSVTNSQARLYNVTTGSPISYGRCAISSSGTSYLFVEGRFTVAGATAIRVEAQCSVTELTDGFGKALSFGGTEVYAGLELIKE